MSEHASLGVDDNRKEDVCATADTVRTDARAVVGGNCSLIVGREPVPDFDACNTCGADAKENVVWDIGDGWTCTACWATDGGD